MVEDTTGVCGCLVTISRGTVQEIIETAQQVAWISAALRVSKTGAIEYSVPVLSGRTGHFAIENRTGPLPEGSSSCWYQLFTNPVIVPGFPLAPRMHNEQGLEISIDLMAALIGARHAVAFQGGFVIKGFSAMLVPVKYSEDSIQWHMINNSTEERMAYQEASIRCPSRCSIEEVNEELLRTTRAFLGWWERAETYLGSDRINYDELDWSSARETRRSIKITGGSLGFQNFMAGQVNFVLGPKDGRLHLSQKGPFEARLRSAEKHPVVLYDNDDRRGWLVSAIEVILHVIFGRNHLRPYKVGNKPIRLAPRNPNSSEPIRLALIQNQHIQLYDNVQYTYGDAVLDLWSNLEILIDKTHAHDSASGFPVQNPFRNELHGWEIMSLVEETPVLRRKQRHIDSTSGGWVNLVKDLDAVILFGRGFGEIIRPVQTITLCEKWRYLPKGNDFLAVSCQLLREIMYQAGSRNDQRYLTSTGLRLSKKSELFTPCKHPGARSCDCLRVQRIDKSPFLDTLEDRNPFPCLPDRGCVIFGEVRRLNFRPHKKLTKKSTTGNKDCKEHSLEVNGKIRKIETDVIPRDLSSFEDSAEFSNRECNRSMPLASRGPKRKQFIIESSAPPILNPESASDKEDRPCMGARPDSQPTDSQENPDDKDDIHDVPMVKLNVTPTPVLRHKGNFERHEADCICRACRLEKNSQYKVIASSSRR